MEVLDVGAGSGFGLVLCQPLLWGNSHIAGGVELHQMYTSFTFFPQGGI